MSDCQCGDGTGWAAWHDRMPGVTPTLYVQGSCLCPTPQYTLQLRPHSPQGSNPEDYLLDLVAVEPEGPVPDVITATPVFYTEETETRYTTVSIMPDGPLSVPVLEVSRS